MLYLNFSINHPNKKLPINAIKISSVNFLSRFKIYYSKDGQQINIHEFMRPFMHLLSVKIAQKRI